MHIWGVHGCQGKMVRGQYSTVTEKADDHRLFAYNYVDLNGSAGGKLWWVGSKVLHIAQTNQIDWWSYAWS